MRSKTAGREQRLVWRISQTHPLGEWVEVVAVSRRNRLSSVTHEHGFFVSSLDLLSGADVTETAMDTLPGDLIDAFAPPLQPDDWEP